MTGARAGFALVLAVQVLGGCAGLQMTPPAPDRATAVPAAPAASAADATTLAQAGRWGEALDRLDAALRLAPEDPLLRETRARLDADWRREKVLIEDRLLIADAENQRVKIALLEQLSRAQPDDLILQARRLYWKEVLDGKLEDLAACAERRVEAQPDLARRCLAVAGALAVPEAVERRLAAVEARLQAGEDSARRQRSAQAQRQRQRHAKRELDRARAAIEARDYRGALDILAGVEKLQPNNREVSGLQRQALELLSPQVEALVKLGDHLYLDEQLDAAVATWQAALTLQPGDEEIAARIDRARTVLQRLETLRRQQHGKRGLAEPAPR